MKRPPGLRSLQNFHAIVRLGSVTAAAREAGLTQPAASRLLGQLEQDVGFELFHRDRGRLIPTADGLLLFEEVQRVLQRVDRVQELADDIAAYRVGQLKLVAPPSFTEGLLPELASRFLEQFPKVHLTIDSQPLEVAKSMIATRAADAGFVRLPLDRPDLHATPVMCSRTACVLRADHPLAAAEAIGPEMLRGTPLVMLGLGRSSRTQIEAAFAARLVRPLVRVETHTIGSACALAARGIGVTIVNEDLARAFLRDGVVLRPFEPAITHEYAFATAASAAPSRLASAFLEIARASFAGA